MGHPRFRTAPWLLLGLSLVLASITTLFVRAGGPPETHQIMLARTHFEKGMKLLGAGSEKEGEAELLEAIKAFPDFADAHVELGNLAMRRKDYTAGLEWYLQAKTALTNLQGLSRRQEVERRKRLQESMDILRERIDQLRMSNRPADQGELSEAMAKLEKLQHEQTKLFTQDEKAIPAQIHFLIGNARMSLEQYDQAIEDYGQALSLRPGYGEVHNNLAVIYFYRKDYARTWEHLLAAEKAGIRINPQFREDLSAVAPEPPPPGP